MKLKLLLPVLSLAAGLLACRIMPVSAPAGENRSGQPDYAGVGSSSLPAHQSRFNLTFRGERDWSYALETIFADRSIGRDLDIDGVPMSVSPGDVRLVIVDDQVRMVGEATGGACWIFPSDSDLERSFLTPDSLFRPGSVNLTELEGGGAVAGRESQRYSLQALEGSQWQEVSGDLWLDVETGAVLKMEFSARGQDPFFGSGAGSLEGSYQVTGFGGQEPDSIAGCDLPYPLPPNAAELVYVEDYLAFATPQSRQAVVQFYQRGLEEQGWTIMSEPQIGEFGATMTFQREGVLVEISVRDSGDRTEVEILTEPAG